MDVRTIASTLSMLAELRNATHLQPAARSIALGTVCLILAVWAGIAAIGCAAAALWSYALPTQGPVGAALIVTLAFLILAAALALTAWIEVHQRRKVEPPTPDFAEQAMKLGQQLSHVLPSGDEIGKLVKDNAGTLVLAALVAGIVSGTHRK
jgi:hypothetical protein